MKRTCRLRTFGASAALCLLAASPAPALNLDLERMGALLVFPFITGGQTGNPLAGSSGDVVIPTQDAWSLYTITNGTPTPLLLKIYVIDGTPGGTWSQEGFDCELTGRETTTLIAGPSGLGTGAYAVECSDGSDTEGDPVLDLDAPQNGLLVVVVADPLTGEPVSEDRIFGSAIVVDSGGGYAYGFEPETFQAGVGPNDGDEIFRLDGLEYRRSASGGATQLLAPRASGNVAAELILFTLDGTAGNAVPPRARITGTGWNDDETSFPFDYTFDCFDIVALEELDAGFAFAALGSVGGHLAFSADLATAPASDDHDAAFGNGDDERRRQVGAWIAQLAVNELIPAGHPVAGAPAVPLANGPVAWGRRALSTQLALVPDVGDQDAVLALPVPGANELLVLGGALLALLAPRRR